MRVLHVINDAQVGGAQTLIEGMALYRRPGDEVRLVVLLGPDTLTERYARAFDRVHYLKLARRRPNVVRALRTLRRLVADFRPDVVHSHLEQSDLLVELLDIGDAVRMTTVHTSGYSSADRILTRWIARTVGQFSRRFDAVIASDDSSLPFMRKYGYRSDGVVIRNGVVVPEAVDYRPDRRTFLCLARWHAMKGFPELFASFDRFTERHPGWTLVCAGSDMTEENPDLTALLDRMSPTARAGVDLRGPVADIRPLLEDASALVLASTYGETFVLVGMEAAVAGVPVIITDIGGSREFVVADDLLAVPGSVEDFTRALEAFADRDDAARADLSRRSRQLGIERFSVDATVQAYFALYEDALARKRGGVASESSAR